MSTAYRLLATLETAGFVRRNPTGAFSCGTRLLQIGLTALQNFLPTTSLNLTCNVSAR